MSDVVVAAGVAAATSLAVSVAGPWIGRLVEASRERRLLVETMNLQHLAPLRQQLADTTFRNRQVLDRVRHGETGLLACVSKAGEAQGKPTEWFAHGGQYLASTAYYTARLFAEMVRLREAFPFLRLQHRDKDAELTALVLRIHLAFAGQYGVYYAVQETIGQDMLLPDGKVAGFLGFSQAVRDPERGIWYAQLLQFYLLAASGRNLNRLEHAVAAMEALSRFLDEAVGASASVSDRLRLESEAQEWRDPEQNTPATGDTNSAAHPQLRRTPPPER